VSAAATKLELTLTNNKKEVSDGEDRDVATEKYEIELGAELRSAEFEGVGLQ